LAATMRRKRRRNIKAKIEARLPRKNSVGGNSSK